MATATFWARADSVTANNSTLNPIGITGANGVPAFQLTFDSGPNGDLFLDQIPNPAYVPGGSQPQFLPDPDTTVIINGQSYPFTLQLVGTLPFNNSNTPDQYEGKQVALIVVVIGGVPREYFFLLDGSGTQSEMNAFGNGAITLNPVIPNPPPTPICFCAGTAIRTPTGYRPVEELRAGDLVLTEAGTARPLAWTGESRFGRAELLARPELRPVRIPASSLGPGRPWRDLLVSPQHRIVLEGAAASLVAGAERVLVPARHLLGSLAEPVPPEAEVRYFHLLLEEHEILDSNGLASESFQPARRSLEAMSGREREVLERVLDALGRERMLSRSDALPSLARPEALVLAHALHARLGHAVPAQPGLAGAL